MAISNDRQAFLASPYDDFRLDSTAVTALANLTTANTVRDVLDILNGVASRNRVTTVNSIGYANSAQACDLCYYITTTGGTFTLRSTGSVNYVVDWGDGSSETSTSNNLEHTYAAGDYIIKIASAVVYQPYFNNSADENLINEIHTTGIDFGTSLASAWYGANNMTRFNAAFDVTAGVTIFFAAWYDCTSLTSFPLIDVSNGDNFSAAWYNCNQLTSFPANFFDSWTGTPATNCLYNAWVFCSSLTATSVENILNSIDTSGQSAPVGGGPDITIDYNVASGSPNISTAVTNLKSRGWTITLNGVAQ